jgi:hypothetical protein
MKYRDIGYTPRQILDAVKKVKANPSAVWSVPAAPRELPMVWTSADFREWVQGCIHAKINSKIKGYPTGRKTEGEFLRPLYHLRNLLISKCRLRTHDVLPIYRARLAARIDDSED